MYRSATACPRFGGPTAARKFAVEMQWLVGGLFCLVALLSIALVFSTKAEVPASSGATQLTQPPEKAYASEEILVARQRIEERSPIQAEMLTTVRLPAEQVPLGALRAEDLSRVTGLYTTRLVSPESPITTDLLTSRAPQAELPIPAGYRAVTVPIDELSSNAFQVRPNQRVDLILTHPDTNGRPEVTPVVRMVKVLSIGNARDPREERIGARSATLLVTMDDALRVELAKKLGTLSLILAGSDEVPADQADANPCGESCLYRAKPVPLPPSPGKMCTTDPATHQPVCFELRDGHWQASALG